MEFIKKQKVKKRNPTVATMCSENVNIQKEINLLFIFFQDMIFKFKIFLNLNILIFLYELCL